MSYGDMILSRKEGSRIIAELDECPFLENILREEYAVQYIRKGNPALVVSVCPEHQGCRYLEGARCFIELQEFSFEDLSPSPAYIGLYRSIKDHLGDYRFVSFFGEIIDEPAEITPTRI